MLDAKKVGEVIQEYREKRGLSQEVVSGLADIGRTHLSAIERGVRKPTLETFFKIADALDILPSELMKMIEKNVKVFIINLEQVDYIDSSGIGALIYICSTIKKMNLKLAISNIHGSVKKVIELTKLMGYFPIANSVEEALLMVKE